MTSPWYVLTGGPCAGKSTILDALAKRGFRTVPEAARSYIDAELAKGRLIEDIRRDEVQLQEEIIRIMVDIEKMLPHDETIFFDRGLHDGVAYLKHNGVERHAQLEAALANTHYKKAFVLERISHINDDVRTESPEAAARIHELIIASYQERGVSVVRVPVLPLEQRLVFILNNL